MTLSSALEIGSDFYGPLFATLDANTSDAGNWAIERNPQRSNYESVREEDGDQEHSWLSEEHKQAAYEVNSMVVLRWYKDTQVGSYDIAALDIWWLAKTLVEKFPEIFA
jgi:hypothetical protein